ncbi:MAG: hypothetical protein Q8R91_03675 [Candidatus Omnitrophota bacterium]|nr:hypothetical protein [Candidatus Omnitrophota bacterium]
MPARVVARLAVIAAVVLLSVPAGGAAKEPAGTEQATPSETAQPAAREAPAVIELRCPWAERVAGKVTLGSCVPPSCPTGWTNVGASSCSANGIWCGAGCATVGHCSRFCTN